MRFPGILIPKTHFLVPGIIKQRYDIKLQIFYTKGTKSSPFNYNEFQLIEA